MLKQVARIFLLFFAFTIFQIEAAWAQCAMCRSTLENNFSNGDPGIGAGINTGILYLLVLPYLAIMALGYFWYKSSRNAQKLNSGHSAV